MIGLKRGTVALLPHQTEWEIDAERTIDKLKSVLGEAAVDIQHVGSTAIRTIDAKPIIDIAVAVNKIDDVLPFVDVLQAEGIVFRKQDVAGQYLFVMGDFENEIRTHHIHVVEASGAAWKNYIAFRDRLNAVPGLAAEYNALKHDLARRFPNDRESYTKGKAEFIANIILQTEN
ncbi:MAG: GrpB family protein [Clostridia bacterium]|nr:GrpB family protein [Clostridia bacterium]